MADIFVSYTSSDRDWAFWIGHELEKLGHTPHVHEWELSAGDDIAKWMEKRHHDADHILYVISKAYLTKSYSSWERRTVQWAAAGVRSGFALPVFIEECEAPTLLAQFKRCDLHGLSEADAQARFKAYLGPARAKPKPSGSVPFPGKKFALSNIPIRVPRYFLGRDGELAAIEGSLRGGGERVAVAALYGLRGVGKTTLAAAYAERHQADYRATWWIRAQTESTMRADLAALGVRLGWVAFDEKEEPALETVRERLRDEGEGLLLIYDTAVDATSLRTYLPTGGAARVLVTSAAHAWRGVATRVEVRVWPKQVGADYFIARTGREKERAEAEALSEALGGLPLAHEQAAAYCERLGISLVEYRKRFEATPARLLDTARDASADYHGGLTVAKLFALAIDEAAKLHPAAEPLICYAAQLPPEPIPLFLFSEGREKFGEPLASELAGDGLDEAVAALRTFALVDRETIADERDSSVTTETIRLQRIVRVAAAGRRQDAAEAGRRVLIEAMAIAYPPNVDDDPSAWPRARRLDALALDLVAGPDLPPTGAETAAAFILDRLAAYRLGALAAYGAARPLFERALAIRERALGPEHPSTATSLNNLALLLQAQGHRAGARPLYERALTIREKVLGPEHPSTAASLDNLARLRQDQGDLIGARPLYERALTIREKALGPEHPDTALSLNNLALLLQAQGEPAGARPLFERALAIREKTLGPMRPATATSLDNLAGVLKGQGDLAGARPLYERALAIRDSALGPEHPSTATSLNNFARLLQDQGDLAHARPLFERALAIDEKVYGLEHPEVAKDLNNLASLFQAQGDVAAALPLYQRALTIADILYSRGDLEEALLVLRDQVLPAFERLDDVRSRAVAMSKVADILFARGELDEALRIRLEEELPVYERVGDVRARAVTMGRIADILESRGELDEALRIRREEEFPIYERLGDVSSRITQVARVAAAELNLGRLDEHVDRLPEGTVGVLTDVPKLRSMVQEIAQLQRRLEASQRPVFQEPLAEQLVTKIENFGYRVGGLKEPLASEFRVAALAWASRAVQQLDEIRSRLEHSPKAQVFRAGNPVDRSNEAFVPRVSTIELLDRQVMLAQGCPGLLIYGRRRMGKSTLLRNLSGFLPTPVRIAYISMENPGAFSSQSSFIDLIIRDAWTACSEIGPQTTTQTLSRMFAELEAINSRLSKHDERLLIACDEFEMIDRKIGESVFSVDLLHTVRESIQNHRRIIWAFIGSHSLDELVHANWASFFVSLRTVEILPFTPEETRLLLTEPLKHSPLWAKRPDSTPHFTTFWSMNSIGRVHAETGGWPHLVQLVAETCVDLANDRGLDSVDVSVLERALDESVRRGDTVLRQLIEGESVLPGEFEYLRGFREKECQPEPSDPAVRRALRRRQLGVSNGGLWLLRAPLMRRWIVANG